MNRLAITCLTLSLTLAFALPGFAQMPPGMPDLVPGAVGLDASDTGTPGPGGEPPDPRGPKPAAVLRFAGFAFPAGKGAKGEGGEEEGDYHLAMLTLPVFDDKPSPGDVRDGGGGDVAGGVKRPLGDLVVDGEKYFIVEGKLAGGGGTPGAGGPEGGPKLDGLEGKLSMNWFTRPEVAPAPGAEQNIGAPQGKPRIVGEITLKGADKTAAKERGGEKKFRVLSGRASTKEGAFDLYLLPLPGAPPRGGH